MWEKQKEAGRKRKPWPEHCPWPEPLWDGKGSFWDWDLAEMTELDERGEELKEIRYYMDGLVEEGRLNEDYSLNEDYDLPLASAWKEECGDEEDASEEDQDPWEPEKGLDYWDNVGGFDVESWEEDLSDHINRLKIDICDPDPVSLVREVIQYSFINENLLRQAFTRRAFALEYGISGCSEELEFYGDQALSTVVTRELYQKFGDLNIYQPDAPFRSAYQEGALSKLRTGFVSGEHLSRRAAELGLDKLILYGTGEAPSESAAADMMEALIGAVAVESDWDWALLEDVVDRLVCVQLEKTDEYIKVSSYERLNAWHQRRFGTMPEYELWRNRRDNGLYSYQCSLRYLVPENDKGIWTSQRTDTDEWDRSSARDRAAEKAIVFLKNNGLWMNLADSGIRPELENSINQLQELFQKKYVEEKPVYEFVENLSGGWNCRCRCDGFIGFGNAPGKTGAKKAAALMVLEKMMRSAGLGGER